MKSPVYVVTKSPVVVCDHGNPSLDWRKSKALVETSSLLEVRRALRALGIGYADLLGNYDDHIWWLEATIGDTEGVQIILQWQDDGGAVMDYEQPYRQSRYDDDWNIGNIGHFCC